jgi:hypothetical protein
MDGDVVLTQIACMLTKMKLMMFRGCYIDLHHKKREQKIKEKHNKENLILMFFSKGRQSVAPNLILIRRLT